MATTRLQLGARRQTAELLRALGQEIRVLREDAGLTMTAVARVAGIDRRHLARIEAGEVEPSIGACVAVLAALGADMQLRCYPRTGAPIRDRWSASMGETLVRALDPRWKPSPEVPVIRPARGVIDWVLAMSTPLGMSTPGTAVVTEVHSDLRRLEQQIRWHREKELSLPSSKLWPHIAATGPPATSRLLVLRSTQRLRGLAVLFEGTLRAAYPARYADLIAALTSDKTSWPEAGIVWMRVDAGGAELLDRPPRGVRVGR